MIFPDSENSKGSAQLDAERETLMQMGGINYANVSKLMKLPDLDDMDYDPAGVYMALTGVENAAATSQDCMSIVLDRVTEKVRELSKTVKDKNSSGQTYRYVETDFVKALKHGYVIEIQEPSTIVQPGVLVGLNSLLEQSGSITLPTGEVIQRPASVIKELVENAIDAGATSIKIVLKDAGRTLIQVIDNGTGMSETDARLAFERHATSKIKSADDLFACLLYTSPSPRDCS